MFLTLIQILIGIFLFSLFKLFHVELSILTLLFSKLELSIEFYQMILKNLSIISKCCKLFLKNNNIA